jgi:hypothetical protein
MEVKLKLVEIARKGGQAVLAKYGTEHFRRLQALSWAKQCAADPRAAFRLSRAGLKAIDPFPANGAWTPQEQAIQGGPRS